MKHFIVFTALIAGSAFAAPSPTPALGHMMLDGKDMIIDYSKMDAKLKCADGFKRAFKFEPKTPTEVYAMVECVKK